MVKPIGRALASHAIFLPSPRNVCLSCNVKEIDATASCKLLAHVRSAGISRHLAVPRILEPPPREGLKRAILSVVARAASPCTRKAVGDRHALDLVPHGVRRVECQHKATVVLEKTEWHERNLWADEREGGAPLTAISFDRRGQSRRFEHTVDPFMPMLPALAFAPFTVAAGDLG